MIRHLYFESVYFLSISKCCFSHKHNIVAHERLTSLQNKWCKVDEKPSDLHNV